MNTTPKSLRLQIGLFGRTNVGKSSFLNMIAGQDVAVTSPVPGTTTDVVEKAMELLPIGPVLFLDTGGLDDVSVLAEQRIHRTEKIFGRADVAVLVAEAERWTEFEERVLAEARQRNIPCLIVINKTDLQQPSESFMARFAGSSPAPLQCSCATPGQRELQVVHFKESLMAVCPDEFLNAPPLVGDLLPAGGLAVLIVPIDLQAPKGRLILPQVQTIRDALDADAATLVVKEREYAHALQFLRRPPDLVICDSQVVLKMVADTPPDIRCTTFSTLFARYKGDLAEEVRGVTMLDRLEKGDRVLIAEACSHHALEDDIGRVKIPRWVRQYAGADIQVDVATGRDYPENLSDYRLIIHCGACMLTRREMLLRIQQARNKGVAITNYGICISFVQGVLERVLSPFPAALAAFQNKM
ncbi:MAG: [FeFe] hydrogenase H-cluster maturation GTPase HydF [Lentisphaerota bacterium]